jgi:ATP synthase protein I
VGNDDEEKKFLHMLAAKERRTVEAKEGKETIAWEGVGRFGMVGWSVTVPVLVALLIGWVLDRITGYHHLWVTVFFFIGLIVGCVNTVYWLFKEYGEIDEDKPHKHE